MATKIDIGGELNPRTVEGIVADASTIIDRTAEKRQDEINSEVSESLEGKQDVIADLETIRSGAASGSTAIQPTQIEDVVRHVDTGALEPLLDPSDYATTDQLNQLGQEVTDNSENIVNLQQEIDSIQPIIIEGNVTNAPDEEDITTDENDLLKFANRPTAVNQMGYVILRKNKTFAEQVTDENTIYEIRYDFDLDGASVTIPAGCVLKFVGGVLRNGTILFNNTFIDAPCVPIFKNISIPANDSDRPLVTQDVTYLDWFENDADNGQHASFLGALQIASKVVCSQKEYVFNACFTDYQSVKHDAEIDGGNAIFRFTETFPDATDYPDILYHSKFINIHDLTVLYEPENALRTVDGNVRHKSSRFCSGMRAGEPSAILNNVSLYVEHADSGQNTLYETYRGKDFIIKNCKKIAKVSNNYPGGGAFAWFMFEDGNESANILIENCEIVTEGADEAIAINKSGAITTKDISITASIKNCKIENIFTEVNAGLIKIGDNFGGVGSSKVSNISLIVNDCVLQKHVGSPELIKIGAVDQNVLNCSFVGSTFSYDGDSDFNANLQSYPNASLGIIVNTVGTDGISNETSFSRCSFKAKYIFNNVATVHPVKFADCLFDVDMFARAIMHPSEFKDDYMTFNDCRINLLTGACIFSTNKLEFKSCVFYSADGEMLSFPAEGYPVDLHLYNCLVNDARVPDVDKYHVIGWNRYSYKLSPIVPPGSLSFRWHNDLGVSATIQIAGQSITVAEGAVSQQKINLTNTNTGSFVPVVINGITRYIYIGTLDSYNQLLANKFIGQGGTSARPTVAFIGHQYYDTDLGKMIVWNGTAWANMDGSALS